MKALILATVLMFVSWPPHAAQAYPAPANAFQASTVTATGSATIAVEPNEGYVTVGVTTIKGSADEALTANGTTMSKVLKTLATQGVSKKNIKTVQFNVAPHFKETVRENVRELSQDGVEVTNMVAVTVCDLPKFGRVLDACFRSGANAVGNVAFGHSGAAEFQGQALTDAVKEAKKNARLMINGFDFEYSIGRVISVSQSDSYRPRHSYVTAAMSEGGRAQLSGGTVSFSADVTVVFEITKGVPTAHGPRESAYPGAGQPLPLLGHSGKHD